MEGSEKKYYRIGEVAEILGVTASTLRFWEGEFGSLRPKRNAKGTRFYTRGDLERLRQIRFLVKDRGLHIEAARRELRNNPEGTERLSRAVARLHEIKSIVERLLSETDSMR